MLDGMFDRVYPVLNVYGDAIEGLDLRIESTGPNTKAVRLGHLMKRRIERLRRFAWDSRYLLSEISQDQFHLLPAAGDVIELEGGGPRLRPGSEPAVHVQALLQSGLAQASDVSWTCNAWRKRCEAIGAQFDRCAERPIHAGQLCLSSVGSECTMRVEGSRRRSRPCAARP